jgi:hypothetical protein
MVCSLETSIMLRQAFVGPGQLVCIPRLGDSAALTSFSLDVGTELALYWRG